FGQWVGEYLSAENKRQLWIPEGFAHGFYAASDEVEFVYKCTDFYNPQAEMTILWNDPELNIRWPFSLEDAPELAEKDRLGVAFENIIPWKKTDKQSN
ncbi:TPA: dTDP-4-keto-6-deoxy-D-glucose epimerase, partial [Vibrio vulnificus]|nr:dTDP-4-keto-6-deoxy-D-glucose epimerase [Vibrio vulnificus]